MQCDLVYKSLTLEVSQTEGEILYGIPYMWNLKRSNTKEFTKQKEIHRLREQTHSCHTHGYI